MRGMVGFGIVAQMEIANERTRRPRRRFSAVEEARVVRLYKESGLRRAEFCRREGVRLFNLQRWLGKQDRAGEAHFVELRAGGLRSRVVIDLDLEGERGWKSKRDLMSAKFACWRAL